MNQMARKRAPTSSSRSMTRWIGCLSSLTRLPRRSLASLLVLAAKAPCKRHVIPRVSTTRTAGPVGDQLTFCEQPLAVLSDEPVEVPDRHDHEGALPVLEPEVVSSAEGLAGGSVSVQGDGALPIEVRGGVVRLQDRSAQCAQASTNPRMASRSAASPVRVSTSLVGVLLVSS